MKFIFALLACLCVSCAARGAATVSINGQGYVSIADWARANGLKTTWIKAGGRLAASDANTRLVFDVNSHYVGINGVQVALSFPVANVKGAALIAQFDLDKTVRPMLFPSRYVPPKTISTICLDPGHGGKDTGNRVGFGFFAHNEKTYTLALAQEVRRQLKQAGFNVIMTRTRDTFVELPERPDTANRHAADLFVSLHFNATQTGKDQVEGPETYCITPVGASSSNAQGEGSNHGPATANRCEASSLLLAYQMQKSLVANLGVEDRGVRRARFAVLRDATMPAILVEGGYMTNPTEGKRIFDPAYRNRMAAAIVKGILNYQRLTAPPGHVSEITSRKSKKR